MFQDTSFCLEEIGDSWEELVGEVLDSERERGRLW